MINRIKSIIDQDFESFLIIHTQLTSASEVFTLMVEYYKYLTHIPSIHSISGPKKD